MAVCKGIKEFTGLCQKYDPGMTESSIKLTFETSGAIAGTIDLEQFYSWCVMMFGTAEEELEEVIRDLLKETGDQMNRTMSARRKELSNQVFFKYDVDGSGQLDLPEFTGIYRAIDESSSEAFISKQVGERMKVKE